MKVAMLQVASPPQERAVHRRERVGQMVAQARGADLVVLPELWAPGYFAFDRYDELAEPLEGATVEAEREWARILRAHLHLGSILERDRQGRLHNTAVLIAPDGRLLHTYRKRHVFGYQSREAELLTAGETISAVDTRLGSVGSTTCYDLRFPELWRALVDAGAETVLVPSAWPAARRAHWQLFVTTRAVEQQMLIIVCNAFGEQHGTTLGGHRSSTPGARCWSRPAPRKACPSARWTASPCSKSERNSLYCVIADCVCNRSRSSSRHADESGPGAEAAGQGGVS